MRSGTPTRRARAILHMRRTLEEIKIERIDVNQLAKIFNFSTNGVQSVQIKEMLNGLSVVVSERG